MLRIVNNFEIIFFSIVFCLIFVKPKIRQNKTCPLALRKGKYLSTYKNRIPRKISAFKKEKIRGALRKLGN